MKKQTWPIVAAFVVGWILAPMADPPAISASDEVVVISVDTGHSMTDKQLASR